MKNPREAALLALYFSRKNRRHIADTLRAWREKSNPERIDAHLAEELAYGVKKREISLQFLETKIPRERKKTLKGYEQILLHLAIYQYVYLSRIPLYAIVNETVDLAKKYCHKGFANFLNAVLRKFNEIDWSLPEKKLDVYYSFPQELVAMLQKEYPREVKTLLELFNQAPLPMMRIRPGYREKINHEYQNIIEEVGKYVGEVTKILDPSLIAELGKRKEVYIQNVTPAFLMQTLAKTYYGKPQKILDLCASPGGKTLMIHDLYPEAKLWANDLSEKRLQQLDENINKYELDVMVSCQNAETFEDEKEFDLIILDVPCSNSGVLHKRAEARYQITKKQLKTLASTQFAILKNASHLLKKSGQIWYLTCSILQEENEMLIEKAAEKIGLQLAHEMQLILPNQDGWDGGFACALFRK